MHGRVPHKGHIDDLFLANSSCLCRSRDQLVEATDDDATHLLEAFPGVSHGIGNSRHNVFPIRNLGIHQGLDGINLPGLETAKVCGHRSRSDVNGEAPAFLTMSRF